MNRQVPVVGGEDGGRFAGALHGAGMQRSQRARFQPLRCSLRLLLAALAETIAGQTTIHQVLRVVYFAVANQMDGETHGRLLCLAFANDVV